MGHRGHDQVGRFGHHIGVGRRVVGLVCLGHVVVEVGDRGVPVVPGHIQLLLTRDGEFRAGTKFRYGESRLLARGFATNREPQRRCRSGRRSIIPDRCRERDRVCRRRIRRIVCQRGHDQIGRFGHRIVVGRRVIGLVGFDDGAIDISLGGVCIIPGHIQLLLTLDGEFRAGTKFRYGESRLLARGFATNREPQRRCRSGRRSIIPDRCRERDRVQCRRIRRIVRQRGHDQVWCDHIEVASGRRRESFASRRRRIQTVEAGQTQRQVIEDSHAAGIGRARVGAAEGGTFRPAADRECNLDVRRGRTAAIDHLHGNGRNDDFPWTYTGRRRVDRIRARIGLRDNYEARGPHCRGDGNDEVALVGIAGVGGVGDLNPEWERAHRVRRSGDVSRGFKREPAGERTGREAPFIWRRAARGLESHRIDAVRRHVGIAHAARRQFLRDDRQPGRGRWRGRNSSRRVVGIYVVGDDGRVQNGITDRDVFDRNAERAGGTGHRRRERCTVNQEHLAVGRVQIDDPQRHLDDLSRGQRERGVQDIRIEDIGIQDVGIEDVRVQNIGIQNVRIEDVDHQFLVDRLADGRAAPRRLTAVERGGRQVNLVDHQLEGKIFRLLREEVLEREYGSCVAVVGDGKDHITD